MLIFFVNLSIAEKGLIDSLKLITKQKYTYNYKIALEEP